MRTKPQTLSIHLFVLIPILLLVCTTFWSTEESLIYQEPIKSSTNQIDSGRVFGTFYLDGDNNCILDTNSIPLSHYDFFLLESSSLDTTVVTTDENGYYESRLPHSQYIIIHSQEVPQKHTCAYVNRVILDSINTEFEYSNLFQCTYDLDIEYNYPDTFRIEADSTYFIEMRITEKSGIRASGLNLNVITPIDIDSVEAPSGIFKSNTREFKQSEDFDIAPNDSLTLKLYFSSDWQEIIGQDKIKLDIRLRNNNETSCIGKSYQHLKTFWMLPPYHCRPFIITNKRQEDDDIFRVKCGKQDTVKYYFTAWENADGSDYSLVVQKDRLLNLEYCNFNHHILDSSHIQVTLPNMVEGQEYFLEMVFFADCDPEQVTSIPSTVSLNITAFSDDCLMHYDTNYYSYTEQAWIYGDYYDLDCNTDRYICDDTSYVILSPYQRDTNRSITLIKNPVNRVYPYFQRRTRLSHKIINSDPTFDPRITVYYGLNRCDEQLDNSSHISQLSFRDSGYTIVNGIGNLNLYYSYNPDENKLCTIQVINHISYDSLDIISNQLDIPTIKWSRNLYNLTYEIQTSQIDGSHILAELTTEDSTYASYANRFVVPVQNTPQSMSLSASVDFGEKQQCHLDSGFVSWTVDKPNFVKRSIINGKINLQTGTCQSGQYRPLAWHQVNITNGIDHYITYTDSLGNYSLSLLPDNYFVSIPQLDSLQGVHPCRTTQLISVQPNSNPTFETTYLESNTCQFLDVSLLTNIVEYERFDRFFLFLDFKNYSNEIIQEFEVPFTFSEKVKVELVDPAHTTLINDKTGTIRVPDLASGESFRCKLRMDVSDIRYNIHEWGEVKVCLDETRHCYNRDTVTRSFHWKKEYEAFSLFSSEMFYDGRDRAKMHVSMGEDQLEARNMNLIHLTSSRKIDPSTIHLMRNGASCTTVEFSEASPNEISLIQDCPQSDDVQLFAGMVFGCDNCTQFDKWSLTAREKEGFFDFSKEQTISIQTPFHESFNDTSGNFWHTAPIICEGNSSKYLSLLPNPETQKSQEIFNCFGESEEVPYAHWLTFIGNGARIHVTLDSLQNCWPANVVYGILEGNPDKWNWISCLSSKGLLGQTTIDSKENTNYYIVISGISDLTCPLPLITLESTETLEYDFPPTASNWQILDSSFTGGSISICTDAISDYLPRITLSIEDSSYTALDTFGCFNHTFSGTNNMDFTIVSDYGITGSACKEVSVVKDSIELEDRSNYVQVEGQLSVLNDNNCISSIQAYPLPRASLIFDGQRLYRAITDSLGAWKMNIPKGNYEIHPLLFNGKNLELCSQNQSIDIQKDTAILIGVDPLSICADTMIFNVIRQPRHYLPFQPFSLVINIEKNRGNLLSDLLFIRVNNGIEILSSTLNFQRISQNEIIIPIHLTRSTENLEFGIEMVAMDTTSTSFSFELNADQNNCENFAPLIQEYEKEDLRHCAASVICNSIFSDTNSYNMNIDFPASSLCYGQGAPNNLKWYKFTTVDTFGSITAWTDPGRCETGQGIQAGILEGSCNSNIAIDCNADCNRSTFSLSGEFNSDTDYFLWIDGCNGDVCPYTLEFNIPLLCDEIFFEDELDVIKTYLCNTKVIRVRPPNKNIQGTNTWVVNGDTTIAPSLELINPQDDTLNIKLIGSRRINNGPLLLDTICDTIIVDNFNNLSGFVQGQITTATNCDSSSSTPLPGVNITFHSSNYSTQVQSDSMGKYSTCLYQGIYTVLFEGNNLSNFELCPFHNFTILKNDSLTQNFKLRQDSCQPISTKISGLSRFRCNGPERKLELNISNLSLGIFVSPPILVDVDTFVAIQHINGAYVDSVDILNAHEALIYFKNLEPGMNAKADIRVIPNCDDQDNGQHFCIKSYFYTPVKNCFKDTTVHYCSIIRNSYDPNDLQAFPIGETEKHYIENQIWIEYLLRYQNQGTDTAFNISIDHLFSDPFDPSSFQLIESSFAGLRTYINTDNLAEKITFELPNIDLLNEKTNEPASHGYVRYRLRMDSLPELYRHSSYADIFFDYNPAIRTNTVYHTITTDYFFSSDTLDLCVGDSFNDWTFSQDTIVHDTLVIPGPDSIRSYVVRVASDRHNEIDTSICPGSIIVFQGRSLFAEDTYYFSIENSEFCDSLVIVDLSHKYYTEVHLDTTIVAGGSFMGITVEKDTTFYQFIESPDFMCRSILPC